MSGTLGMVLVLLGLLAAAGAVAWWAWTELAGVTISTHGWIALGLGASATLIVGVGLMYLVYYSHRRGYDDEAGRD